MNTKRLFFLLLPVVVVLAAGVLAISTRISVGERGGCSCVNLETATGEFEPDKVEAYFEGKRISPPLARLPELSQEDQKVLGEVTGEEKWIEVDLSEQKLRAWQGETLFLESLVSSGKWAPTPQGEFRVWSKFKYGKMEGGKKETHTYYYLPNVPYIMYFHNGFGLHGTYWHNNFGHTMSHGCVNLPTPVAEKLFYWTGPILEDGKGVVRATRENLGTRIVIHE